MDGVCVCLSGLQAAAMSVKTGTDGAPLLSTAGGMVLIYAHVLSLKKPSSLKSLQHAVVLLRVCGAISLQHQHGDHSDLCE